MTLALLGETIVLVVEAREFYKSTFGPTMAVYAHNADDPERVEALDRDFLAMLERAFDGGRFSGEYLVAVGTRA